MNCPKCGKQALVIDSRQRNKFRIRRYNCEGCGNRFNTVEITELTPEAVSAVYRLTNPFQFRKIIQAVYLKMFEPKLYKIRFERNETNENGSSKA